MSDTQRREVGIFDAAWELPPERRAAYLAQACGNDAALRQRIEALLKASEPSRGFLDAPGGAAGGSSVLISEKPGDTIGRYKLLQQIGEGGCGVVYMAEQQEPVRRRVALKVIKLGMDTRSVIARFEAERQALAMMDHPNIAKVLDAGATDTGRPYFVMELVRGMKITDYCDEARLSIRPRLDLFVQVCRAIQHAHQKGIIHRDIKPSNILVTVNDGVAVPKVIDFGIAKATSGQQLTDKTIFTAFDQFIGTPAYMSPEQAVLTSVDIDTRSDIYGLGVLLYELLTGKTPFDVKELLAIGLDEMRRTIREREPARPSTRLNTLAGDELSTMAQRRGIDAPKLMTQLRGDLDWIAMKCLEKDRARRYETANGLASDVQRYLDDEPVRARPPSNLYRFQRLVRRNRLAVAATGAVAAALLVGLAISTILLFREKAAALQAIAAERKAEQALAEANQHRDEALKQKQRGDEQAAIAKAVHEFLQNDLLKQAHVLEQVESGFAPEPDLTVKQALNRACQTVEKRFADQPLVEAAIWHTLGNAFWGVGDPLRAIGLLDRSLVLRRQHAGPKAAETIDTMNGLAALYCGVRREAEAIELYRQVLRIRQSTLGSNHVDTLAVRYDLAQVHYFAGRKLDAVQMHEEILRLRKAQLDADHPHVQASMHSLAKLYQETGRLAEAVSLLEETLALRMAARGPDHPRTLETITDLGIAYRAAGQIADAVRLAEKALEASKAKPGPDHPQTFRHINLLATAYLAAGRITEAIALLEEALERQKTKLGAEYRSTTNTKIALAQAYRVAGRYAEAASLSDEALRTQTTMYGSNHLNTITTVTKLAQAWADQQRFIEAEPLFLSAYKSLEQHRESAFCHAEMKATLGALVEFYAKWDKPVEARRWQNKLDEFSREQP